MSRIVWDRPTDRKFETGVEKGVLYVGNKPGVPWNGLISVNDTYTGGEVEGRYQDGIKTYNYAPIMEFESEIQAFTYPEEFEACLGVEEVEPGFFVDEQVREPFGLTYQTRIGDGVVGHSLGYKIHLIYNAIATPNQISRTTMSDQIELTAFSWGLNTFPATAPGFQPASHFIIEPHRLGPRLTQHLNDLLYGAPGIPPRLLYPEDIISIVGDWQVLYPSPNTYPTLDTLPGGP